MPRSRSRSARAAPSSRAIRSWRSSLRAKRRSGSTSSGSSLNEPGLNAKMSELHAAVGLAALDEHEWVLANRRKHATTLRELLTGLPVAFQRGSESSTWQFVPALLATPAMRDELLASAGTAGIQLGTYHKPLHTMGALRRCVAEGSLAVTCDLASRLVSLPMANDTTSEELARIAQLVELSAGATARRTLVAAVAS